MVIQPYSYEICFISIYIGKYVFPIVIHLARGNGVALESIVLSSIYKDLSLLKDWFLDSNMVQTTELVNLYAPFQLVHVWDWERFIRLRSMTNSISHNEQRVARQPGLKMNVGNMKLAKDTTGKSFQWQTYDVAINYWSMPKLYGVKEQYILFESHLNEKVQSFGLVVCGK